MKTPARPTREQRRELARELVAVMGRHAPDWSAPADQDLGAVLVDLLAWLADQLAASQDQIADEAALDTARTLGVILHHVLSDASLVVTVDGVRWQPAASWAGVIPGDRVYVVETGADGTTTLVFGDGRVGARPPTGGSEVVATYRSGAGGIGLTATFRWAPERGVVGVRLGDARVEFEPRRSARCGLLARFLPWLHHS